MIGCAVVGPGRDESAFGDGHVVCAADRVLREDSGDVVLGCPGESCFTGRERARGITCAVAVEDPDRRPRNAVTTGPRVTITHAPLYPNILSRSCIAVRSLIGM